MTLIVFPPPRAESGATSALHASFIAADLPGRSVRSGSATLSELAAMREAAQSVLVVLPACDVALLRVPVPPLPAARLAAALPGIVEEHLLTATDDCVIAAGPDRSGRREVAIADRAWLQALLAPFIEAGWHQISAVPAQCQLPEASSDPGCVAAIRQHDGGIELALRTADGSSAGLLLAAGDDGLADAVLDALALLVPGTTVQLLVPSAHMAQLAQAAAGRDATVEVIAAAPEAASTGAAGTPDLAQPLLSAAAGRAGGLRWRRPLQIAAALLLVNLVALGASWLQLRQEADALRAQMLASTRQSLPAGAVIVDPLAQLRQRHVLATSGDDWYAVLAAADGALRAAAPGNALAPLKSVDYAGSALTLRWQLPDRRPPLESLTAAFGERGFALVEPVDGDGLRVRRQR